MQGEMVTPNSLISWYWVRVEIHLRRRLAWNKKANLTSVSSAFDENEIGGLKVKLLVRW